MSCFADFMGDFLRSMTCETCPVLPPLVKQCGNSVWQGGATVERLSIVQAMHDKRVICWFPVSQPFFSSLCHSKCKVLGAPNRERKRNKRNKRKERKAIQLKASHTPQIKMFAQQFAQTLDLSVCSCWSSREKKRQFAQTVPQLFVQTVLCFANGWVAFGGGGGSPNDKYRQRGGSLRKRAQAWQRDTTKTTSRT